MLWRVESRMSADDHARGHVLSRREALALLGAAGYTLLLGAGAARGQSTAVTPGGCVARPAQTEGPYFVEEALNRSDIRVDPSDGTVKPGTPLEVTLLIARLGRAGCAPLAGARVDVWHSDHLGVYSDVTDPGGSTVGRKFLRGYQLADGEGRVRFVTIYPGAYQGRTVHIHFKVRSPQGQRPGYEFTSQLYFDDALTDRVLAAPPYSARGRRATRNADDGLFRRGGRELMLALAPRDGGYAGTFTVALDGV
jgi:protocatechuate 3,4-dioxygenase beta subunit